MTELSRYSHFHVFWPIGHTHSFVCYFKHTWQAFAPPSLSPDKNGRGRGDDCWRTLDNCNNKQLLMVLCLQTRTNNFLSLFFSSTHLHSSFILIYLLTLFFFLPSFFPVQKRSLKWSQLTTSKYFIESSTVLTVGLPNIWRCFLIKEKK